MLNDSGMGCHVDNVCVNHVFYADDLLCLMAPCAIALQQLIKVCHRYSIIVDLYVNALKSFCFAYSSYIFHIRLVVIYRMLPSKANKLCKITFITEFKSYLEHLKSLSGTLLIAGDFNINWIDSGKSNCELKFRRLLNSYRHEQFINVSTHNSDNLIDYIISSADFVTNVIVSDRMSDHYALHCMLSCSHLHKVNKLVYYRQLHKFINTPFMLIWKPYLLI